MVYADANCLLRFILNDNQKMADSDFENGGFYGALHKGFVYVPASFLTCQFVLPAVFLRKKLLPFEFLAA